MKDIFILDACALIAYLNNESGMDVVKETLMKALTNEAFVTMHKLNLLEVYYDIYRRCGKGAANDLLKTISESPINIEPEITDVILEEAGRLKASYKISIADSIALAKTSVSGGTLLTSDHHEFDVVEKSENIKFNWIR